SGYAWDIVGSLAGIGLFTVLSFARAFPVMVFAAFVVAGTVFFRGRTRDLLAYGAAVSRVVMIVARAERAQQYSPYYAMTLMARPGGAGVQILTNGSLHH